ncbi:MAG: hypothetical protein WKG06_41870 [Segetibacter sp.]
MKKATRPIVTDTLQRIIADTLKKPDSILRTDSILPAFSDTAKASGRDTAKLSMYDTAKSSAVATVKKPVDSIYLKLLDNPFTRTKAKPIYLVINERERQSKDRNFLPAFGSVAFFSFYKTGFQQVF